MTGGVIDAGLAMEQIGQQYGAVFGDRAAAQLAFVREESDRLGLNFRDMAASYGAFSAAARGTGVEDEARRIFVAVTETARVLGMSEDQTRGVFRALEQMASKGNVQAEELRGQLGERLWGAFNLAAEAMGITTGELNEMLESGDVLAGDLLPKLATKLEEL